MPIDSLVLKVASRCNLNCSYCYMYNLGDLTYKSQPKLMSFSLIDQILHETKRYLDSNSQKYFQFIFHGGEPLLAPLEWYEYFISQSNKILNTIRVEFSLQTNGVLYNEKWAQALIDLNIGVGFSWDGPKKIHDKFRVHHNGNGSYDELLVAIDVHQNYHNYVGGLAVINSEISAEEFYQNAKEVGFTAINMLFPHLHHSMDDDFNCFQYKQSSVTYGTWLVELFDLWWNDQSDTKIDITFFNNQILLILGKKITTECFGDGENNVLVIETNGDIETSAALKSCGDGFTKEGINIFSNKIDDALDSELVQLFVDSHRNLCKTCLDCSIKHICGGGRINQRYSKETGFDNPSVYCQDIKMLVAHIQNELLDLLNQNELNELNITKLRYEDI